MNILLICFLLLLNLGISYWNAYVCGKSWLEVKSVGGWRFFIIWMAALQSALGFTWCYLIILAAGAFHFHWISALSFSVSLQLGYLLIIPGILFSGLMITIDSWAQAFRQGGALNYGVAAYNTYAQLHNTASAISSMGDAFGEVFGFFSGSDDENAAPVLVIALVLIALFSGVLTTSAIITRVSGSERLLSYEEMEARRLAGGRRACR